MSDEPKVGGLIVLVVVSWLAVAVVVVLACLAKSLRKLGPKRRYKTLAACVGGLAAAGGLAYYFCFVPTPLQAADEARQQIDDNEKALRELNAELRKSLDGAQPLSRGLSPDATPVEDLRAEVKRLRENADVLLALHEKYVATNRALKAVLDRAPGTFRKVADQFASHAKSEKYAEIAKDYVQLKETWSALADQAERRAKQLQTQDPELEKSVDYLKHSALFLARLQAALDSYPANLQGGQGREKFLAQFRQFVQEYEALRKRLREWHDVTANAR
jgi:hypothetical protein